MLLGIIQPHLYLWAFVFAFESEILLMMYLVWILLIYSFNFFSRKPPSSDLCKIKKFKAFTLNHWRLINADEVKVSFWLLFFVKQRKKLGNVVSPQKNPLVRLYLNMLSIFFSHFHIKLVKLDRGGGVEIFLFFHRPEFSDISGTFIETLALNLKAN